MRNTGYVPTVREYDRKRLRFLVVPLFVILFAAGCSPTAPAPNPSSAMLPSLPRDRMMSNARYPVIPIPAHSWYGGLRLENLSEFSFYIDQRVTPRVYPTASGALSYEALLEQNGWQKCEESGCGLVPQPFMTDLAEAAFSYYRYPGGAVTSVVAFYRGDNLAGAYNVYGWIFQCGTVAEVVRESATGIDTSQGCVIQVPPDTIHPTATPLATQTS